VTPPATSIAYLGPAGTFTEEALLSQPDYACAPLEAMVTIGDVLDAIARGASHLGFVPMENAIEGTVNA
jgi:prephenate dehydratase